MIHQDNQLPHDGGEGDFGGFACGNEPVVKRLEEVVAAAGRQGGHVKGAADLSPGSIRKFVFGSVVSFVPFAAGRAPEQKIVLQTSRQIDWPLPSNSPVLFATASLCCARPSILISPPRWNTRKF